MSKTPASKGMLPLSRTCSYIPARNNTGITFALMSDGALAFERYSDPEHLVANSVRHNWAPTPVRPKQHGLADLPVLLIADTTKGLGVMTEMLSDNDYAVAGSDNPNLGLAMLTQSGLQFQAVLLCLEKEGANEDFAAQLLNEVTKAAPAVVMLTRPGTGAARLARRDVASGNSLMLPAADREVIRVLEGAQMRAARAS